MDKTKNLKTRHIQTPDDVFLMSPKNDFCFKKLFGDENNKDILTAFLSAVMKIESRQFQELTLINTELPREFAEDRKGVLDVRVKLKDGTEIDIEIQLTHTKYMAQRTLYYWSKMYTNNIKIGDSYAKLKKCVTINILDFISLPMDQTYSKFHITEDTTGYKLTDVLEIYYLELPKLNDVQLKHQIDENDPVIQWMMFLEASTKEVLEMLSAKNPEIKKAASILEVMSRSETDRLAYEARVAMLHDMATFREEGLEEGIAKGRAEGREEGRVEGREEGRVEGRAEGREEERVDVAKNMLMDGMDTTLVARYAKLDKAAVEKIKQTLD